MQNRNNLYSFFGRMVAAVGLSCILAAVWMNSVIPLVVGGIVLMCTLNFMTGLAEKRKHAH